MASILTYLNNIASAIYGKDYPSIDHVLPVSKGGTHTWNNIKLAHHYCNSMKRDEDIYEKENGQLIFSI